MPRLDFLRQLAVFDPDKFEDQLVDVIGAGATGSYISWLLGKIGIANVRLWDADTIEGHNLANQLFFLEHSGQPKVQALAEMLERGSGLKPEVCQTFADGTQEFGDVVFLLTDTMESRRKIWEGSLRYKVGVKHLIETRMGADSGRVYCLTPANPTHVEAWEATLYSDAEAEVSACGASVSIAPMAALVASVAVWQLINCLNGEEEIENEIILSTRPFSFIARRF